MQEEEEEREKIGRRKGKRRWERKTIKVRRNEREGDKD